MRFLNRLAILLCGACGGGEDDAVGTDDLAEVVGVLDSGCFASVVSARWVVSAAHCPTVPRSFRLLRGVTFGVEHCVAHPDAAMGFGTDVMACRLSSPARLRLAVDVSAPKSGDSLVVTGRMPPAQDGTLGQWEVTAKSVKSEIVVDVPRGVVCAGDSGAPLLRRVSRGWKLVGVVSSRPRSTTCATGTEVRYTSLRHVDTWMATRLAAN